MAKYFVEFKIGISVQADSEEEALEKASYELRIQDYDDYLVLKEF